MQQPINFKGLFLSTGAEKIHPTCEQSIIILSGVWVKAMNGSFRLGRKEVVEMLNLTNARHSRDIAEAIHQPKKYP